MHPAISNSACRAEVHSEGALISGWRPHGFDDVLFCSREAIIGQGLEVHGGIPICAPWFGQGRAGVDVPHAHGLVRYVPWNLVSRVDEQDVTELRWELTGADLKGMPGAEAYPADIWFHYTARFGTSLVIALETGAGQAFTLDQAFHTYFSIDDILTVGIEGIERFPHTEYATNTEGHSPRIAGSLANVDRIHDGAGPVTIVDGTRRISLAPRGAASTVVWNPGPSIAAELENFGDDEWKRMLCVEVGNVQERAVQVAAGSSHTLALEISVTSEEEIGR